jgi:hypothetical protein
MLAVVLDLDLEVLELLLEEAGLLEQTALLLLAVVAVRVALVFPLALTAALAL